MPEFIVIYDERSERRLHTDDLPNDFRVVRFPVQQYDPETLQKILLVMTEEIYGKQQ